jgi:hypothetical protein
MNVGASDFKFLRKTFVMENHYSVLEDVFVPLYFHRFQVEAATKLLAV